MKSITSDDDYDNDFNDDENDNVDGGNGYWPIKLQLVKSKFYAIFKDTLVC
jgi:hypothetical protein